jgi:hypothetical protein
VRTDRSEVLLLFARALAWLPACLAAWYFASPVLSWIPARLAVPLVEASSGPATRVRLSADRAEYELEIAAPRRAGIAAEDAVVDVEVSLRTYTYGIALFLALSLATRGPRRPGVLAIALAVLVILPAWGIAFDALRQVGLAEELAPYLRWPAMGREAVAFGYQVGSLLLPPLAPVVAWLAAHPQVLRPAERAGAVCG